MRNDARWMRGLGVAVVSTFLVVGGADDHGADSGRDGTGDGGNDDES